jgi:probable F420-dependent oxidoreductase
MEIGAHLPVYGAAATREGITLVARRVEALGFDSLWVSDHVVIPWEIRSRYPYNATGDFPLSPGTDFLEPLTALTLAAAVTSRVRLGTSVLVLPHRHPVLTAKMLATLDHLAPGRVILGAGVGWMREEIELFGVPYGRRGAWTDEAIAVMRACWRDDRVSHRGEFFNFENLGCRPRPANGTIPIWIGGHTDRALKRVVSLGDGWHAAFPTPSALGEGIARLRAACQSSGRDPAALTISARLGLSAKRPADDLLAELRALSDLGVAHVILESRMRDVAEMTDIYERFATEVRARL